MKPEAIFVNVGRGAVVHEESLFNALKSGLLSHLFFSLRLPLLFSPLSSLINNCKLGHLGGAAIDVWYNYNYGVSYTENKYNPGNFPFHELPNVIMYELVLSPSPIHNNHIFIFKFHVFIFYTMTSSNLFYPSGVLIGLAPWLIH